MILSRGCRSSRAGTCVTSDGVIVGTVAQVEGDKQADIFDGLAVESRQPTQIRYVPGEQVGAIYPGEVTLKIASADIGTPRAVSRAAARDEVASRKGTALDTDVEVAARKTLETPKEHAQPQAFGRRAGR